MTTKRSVRVLGLLLVGLAIGLPATVRTANADKFYRDPPPLIEQTQKQDLCWAASLESWLRATPKRIPIPQDEIPGRFLSAVNQTQQADGTWRNYLSEAPSGLKILAADKRVRMDYRNPAPSTLTEADFISWLTKGYVYLCYTGTAVGHCVVVYGVGHPTGTVEMVSFMDPLTNRYRNEPLTFFQRQRKIELGTARP